MNTVDGMHEMWRRRRASSAATAVVRACLPLLLGAHLLACGASPRDASLELVELASPERNAVVVLAGPTCGVGDLPLVALHRLQRQGVAVRLLHLSHLSRDSVSSDRGAGDLAKYVPVQLLAYEEWSERYSNQVPPSVPQVHVFKRGELVARIVGAGVRQLRDALEAFYAPS